MGNYHQCLEIHSDHLDIEGKYATIDVPLQQNIELPSLPEWPDLPDFPWPELLPNTSRISDSTLSRLRKFHSMKSGVGMLSGEVSRVAEDSLISQMSLNLAICVPKTCTARQALGRLFFNISSLGVDYTETGVRLPNDKQWVAADYIAIVVFSIIGVLTIFSTIYDLNHSVIRKRDPKSASKVLSAFSVYTNTRRLVTYTAVPGALECLDGIRVLAMVWVIIGHTFSTQLTGNFSSNPLFILNWISLWTSLWITAAPITVDTFFMLSGLLIVYTTAGKLTGMKLLRNVHLFYLNRLLRMFPVLAAGVLVQASIFHRVSDGPDWSNVVRKVQKCRVFWWSTLLHVQNYVNPEDVCLGHTWYLAVDVQLHIISPIILFWVLGKKRTAWFALAAAMFISLSASTIYNFIYEFPGGPVVPTRLDEQMRYIVGYYFNTLTRCTPFFVGMIFGYMLHTNRQKKVQMSRATATVLWVCATILSTLALYVNYPIVQSDWDNQIVDSLINSFMRPAWALSLGWLVFACVHGYGGPINWLLSLHLWKFPARLSYAMYIFHYPMMFVVRSSNLSKIHFSVGASMLKFLSDVSLAVLVAFIVTLVIDAPFSTLIKLVMGGGAKRPRPENPEKELKNGTQNGQLNESTNPRFLITDEAKTKL